MKKTHIGLLLAFSFACLALTGIIIKGAQPNQEYLVEFLCSGRYEIVYVHHGFSEVITTTGVHQVFISRNIDEPWGVSFSVTKYEISNTPLYVSIKTLEGETVYNTAVAGHDGYLFMDCKLICEKLTK